MREALRRRLHGIVPSHFRDPFGLAMRILRSGDPDAWFALLAAGLKIACAPVDRALAPLEQRYARQADAPVRPLLLITGPPRSGTTLVEQALIASLPVAYITNLTSLFPHAPVTVGRLLPRPFANRSVRFHSYYGRMRSFRAPNDGLDLWDCWLGRDRTSIPTAIEPGAAAAMRRFFGLLEHASGRSVVSKNNNLLGCAHLIAQALPTARFVCLRRDPLYLAQSLLVARRQIHGSSSASYGIDDPAHQTAPDQDPIADVCRQLAFFQKLEADQERRLGPERFRVVAYEDFCAAPAATVRTLGRDMLGLEADPSRLEAAGPFRISSQRTLPPPEFERLGAALERLTASRGRRGSLALASARRG